MEKLLAQCWENNITSFLIQNKEYLIHISQSITDQKRKKNEAVRRVLESFFLYRQLEEEAANCELNQLKLSGLDKALFSWLNRTHLSRQINYKRR